MGFPSAKKPDVQANFGARHFSRRGRTRIARSMQNRLKGGEWRNVATLAPYLWEYKWRVVIALAFLIVAKLANVAVPLIMKQLVDRLDAATAIVAVPVALLATYGILRFSTTLFQELRDVVFVRVAQRSLRRFPLGVFRHLHSLSLRFHLERQTGGMTRDIERGTNRISPPPSYPLFSLLPVVLGVRPLAGVVALYIAFTVLVTEWRMGIRRRANELDSKANARAIDSLLNYETVKYFGNEEFEARRYDENLRKYEDAATKSESSLGLLNIGQSLIIAGAVTALMYLAAQGVIEKSFTLGDLVLVNGLLIQLYIPLNVLGMVYRNIKQSLLDRGRMFGLLSMHREIEDRPGAPEVPPGPATVAFHDVDFFYEKARQILHGVSFSIAAGQRVAVVGHSGSGKSTLARLLYRFYDVSGGSITINGLDVRQVKQTSLRGAIGIVPQDTVLFNDTILYNIRYGRPEASDAEVIEAARAAHIHDFIEGLPAKYETAVGERGLKLSGGEKQRVAIARALLKNPRILIFDEATSALDSRAEKAIQAELERIARGRTTLVIAHRLSTVMDDDLILVLSHRPLVERGTHLQLNEEKGEYAKMWELQREAEEARAVLDDAETREQTL